MKKINQNSIVVIGSSSGLGSSLCDYLSDEYNVIGIDNKKNKNKKINFFLCDISVKKNLEKILKKIQKFRIISVINCAAILERKNFNLLKLQDLKKHNDVNLYPSFTIAKLLEKNLIKNKALFLNIGSIHSTLTKKNFFSYSLSKSALTGLTNALAVEYLGKISFNILELGPMKTAMLEKNLKEKKITQNFLKSQPTKSVIEPLSVAKLIKSLIETKDLYITGMRMNVNGGYTSLLNDE